MNQNPSLMASKNLTIDRIYTNSEKQYYFYLGKGNNEDLVRRVLNTRGIWVEK